MFLILAVIFVFIVTGLASPSFGGRQQALVMLTAIVLSVVQFTLPRFL